MPTENPTKNLNPKYIPSYRALPSGPPSEIPTSTQDAVYPEDYNINEIEYNKYDTEKRQAKKYNEFVDKYKDEYNKMINFE